MLQKRFLESKAKKAAKKTDKKQTENSVGGVGGISSASGGVNHNSNNNSGGSNNSNNNNSIGGTTLAGNVQSSVHVVSTIRDRDGQTAGWLTGPVVVGFVSGSGSGGLYVCTVQKGLQLDFYIPVWCKL